MDGREGLVLMRCLPVFRGVCGRSSPDTDVGSAIASGAATYSAPCAGTDAVSCVAITGSSNVMLFFLLLGLNNFNPPLVPDLMESPSPLDFLRFNANALLNLLPGDGLLLSELLPTAKESVLAGSTRLGRMGSDAVRSDVLAAMMFGTPGSGPA